MFVTYDRLEWILRGLNVAPSKFSLTVLHLERSLGHNKLSIKVWGFEVSWGVKCTISSKSLIYGCDTYYIYEYQPTRHFRIFRFLLSWFISCLRVFIRLSLSNELLIYAFRQYHWKRVPMLREIDPNKSQALSIPQAPYEELVTHVLLKNIIGMTHA